MPLSKELLEKYGLNPEMARWPDIAEPEMARELAIGAVMRFAPRAHLDPLVRELIIPLALAVLNFAPHARSKRSRRVAA